MRCHGLALVILAVGHMFIMHVLVELTGGEVNFAFVQSRWGRRSGASTTCCSCSAFVHGANGARVVIGDYVANRTARSLLVGLLLLISAIWLLLGMAVIVFFDPNPRRRGAVLVTLATPVAPDDPALPRARARCCRRRCRGAGLYAALELKQELGPEAASASSASSIRRARTPEPPRAGVRGSRNTEEDHWGGTGSTRSRAATTSWTRMPPR